MESQTGNIVRITNIFDRLKEKKRSKIIPVGFVVGEKNIYLTTNNGRLIIIDILTGKSSSMLKIDNEKNLLFVKGAIPGPSKSIVYIEK